MKTVLLLVICLSTGCTTGQLACIELIGLGAASIAYNAPAPPPNPYLLQQCHAKGE